MSGPKRNPDTLNTIAVVVVGVCSAVLVYVTIVALEAFYVNDSSEVQSVADYGGQEQTAIGHKADEIQHISENGTNPNGTYHVTINIAKKQVASAAKGDGADFTHLASQTWPATKVTRNIDGSSLDAKAGTAPAGAGSGSAAGTGSGAGSGSAAPAPAEPGPGSAAPMVPTGAGPGTGAPTVPGAGGLPNTPAGAGSAAKGHAP